MIHSFTPEDVSYLLSPKAIRERAAKLMELARSGQTHFEVDLAKLPEVAEFVAEVTLANYPKLEIPFHSRWGHFNVGGVDRLKLLNDRLGSVDAAERLRAKLDLVIVSVLLDAGSGTGWKFSENGREYSRSEGLAVASLRMFLNGDFSSSPSTSLRADAKGLQELTVEKLARGFQVTADNPLVGLEGRVSLLRQLGAAVEKDAWHFPHAAGRVATPGDIAGYFERVAGSAGCLPATEILMGVLLGLGPIWPGRVKLGDVPMGDVWPHSLLGKPGTASCLIPFHKLSQWLSYSLIEPIVESGIQVTDVNGLTGLAEYRNGGLLIDKGLIRLRDPKLAARAHRPDSELVIEWRALTVALLDEIAGRVRTRLGKTEAEFPLAKVLEGGTWWAGRKAAAQARPDGAPPLKIDSDGTVF